MQLNIDSIRIDGGTQPRAKLRDDVINEYADLMRSGTVFPPVTVFHDGQDYWLADGFHRLRAWRDSRPNEPIEAEVIPGTLADARWYSYGVNQTHGLRRTNEDKEGAVRAALQHPNAATLSSRQIAEHCGVGETTVRRYRQQLMPTAPLAQSDDADQPPSIPDQPSPRPRTGRDGRTINTAKIGRRRVPSDDAPKTLNGGPISPRARPLIRGHSAPLRLISLNICPDNPQAAAATLWEFFSRTFCEALVHDLTQFLAQEGEHECLFPPAPTTATNCIPATSM
jgi:hypothetical protein